MATIIRQFIYRQDRKVSWKGDHHRILRLGTLCVPDLRILLFLPIQAFARLITLRHILQDTNHLQSQALRFQHDDISAMPQQFLKEITAWANGQCIFPKHTILRHLYFLLTFVQRNLLDVIVFRITSVPLKRDDYQISC